MNAKIGCAVVAVLLAATACTTSDAGTAVPTTVAGHDRAELDVVSGATAVTIRAVDLGTALYRADGARAEVDGDVVRVSVADGASSIHVDVATGVAWTIRLDGGATEESVDFADGKLDALEFGAGATRIEATLPTPSATVPVRMTGGASSFALALPPGVPATVRFAGGAGQANIDGVAHNGIGGGTVLSTSDWTDGANGYTVDAVAGVSALTLARNG
ncbi:hypothetical protein [Labedaea rhizosphaerae]|uniref:Uncharacterized protein n=1 Tax=Labedaea rhizosphaerae TaxID=598644 RepID=A0A4R6RSU4_LABRH|nr:hypothetical protein [Labedaea rhizosphaerae]TDP89943.1 hypothetical protein EV186_11169 [Labedaea rhizosphaerae]